MTIQVHSLKDRGKPLEVQGKPFDPRVVLRLLAYLRPHWLRMLLALACVAAGSVMTLATPYLTKVAIDQNITAGDGAGLVRTAVLIAAAFGGLYISTAGQRYLLSWVGQRVLATLRADLFRNLQRLSLSYHDTHVVGTTISRVINDVSVINDLLSQGLVTLIGDTLVLGGIVVVMISMSPRLALLAFSVLPLMYLATRAFTQQSKPAFQLTRTSVAAVVGDLAEDIAGIRVIQAFGYEAASYSRFERDNRANMEATVSANSLTFAFTPVVEFLGAVATATVLWFGGRWVVGGTVTLGVVVAFLSYVSRFFDPIQELSQIYTTLQAAMAGGERIFELLDAVPDVQDRPGAGELPPIQGRVELREARLAYKPGEEVLHGVSLVIEPGQTVALVGPTGAGKTSVASLVTRFYDATGGAVLVDGHDVREVTQHSLRSQMGLVPQDPFLFPGTVADNIRFGCPKAGDDALEAAARLANAHEFIAALPQGYFTQVLEGGVNLSMGQRQLICLARAALADPRILILDEATSSVDTITEALIQKAVDRLLHGRTAIAIAHRLSTIRNADIICVLADGKIVEQGAHEDLLARGGLYKQLYRQQFLTVSATDPIPEQELSPC